MFRPQPECEHCFLQLHGIQSAMVALFQQVDGKRLQTEVQLLLLKRIKMPPPPKDGQFKSSLFKWENLLQSCSCWDLLNLRVGASWLSWLRFTEGTGRKHPTPSTHSHILILPSSAVDLPARSKTHALGVMESRAGGPCPAVLAWSPFREQRTAERTASTHPCRVCCSHSPMGRRPYMRVVCWWPKRWACIWQWGLYNWQEKTEARGTEATPVAEAGPWGLPCFSPLANCWAWNWAKATTHLFICSGAGSSGRGHACKCPAHSSLGLLEFGPRYHQEWISPGFCDPSPVPVLLKKGNVLMMMYFASHSPQLLIFEGSYWRELIPAKWDLELSNHNLPGPCRNYTLLCVGNSGIKALKKKKIKYYIPFPILLNQTHLPVPVHFVTITELERLYFWIYICFFGKKQLFPT